MIPPSALVCQSWRRTICDGTCARLCHASGGELEQIQFLLGTSRFKPPNGTLGASSEFDQQSMIALGSSRTLDVAEPVVEGLPTTRGIDPLGNLHLELRRTVFLGGCWRRWALSLIVVVTTNDGNRTADSRNHCDTRRLAKCAIVSVPTHKAILPCACLRSLTTRAGCGAPCTYKRALSPCTSIFSLVHSPGTTSA